MMPLKPDKISDELEAAIRQEYQQMCTRAERIHNRLVADNSNRVTIPGPKKNPKIIETDNRNT